MPYPYEKEIRELLESIQSDFFIRLAEYEHYSDISFATINLTLLELFLIAESAAHRYQDNKELMLTNQFPMPAICGVIASRIGSAPQGILDEIFNFMDDLLIKEFFDQMLADIHGGSRQGNEI